MVTKKEVLENAKTFAPYQKTLKLKKIKKTKKGNFYIYINKKKYVFDKDTGVIM